jgi:alanine racemase
VERAGAAVLSTAFPPFTAEAFSSPKRTVPDPSFDPYVEIHPDHLRHNVAEIQRRVDSRPILAVVKNNGYGLGAANVARILDPLAAVHGFAVVKLHEAVLLRDAGIRKPILLMGSCSEKDLVDALARGIIPTVFRSPGGEWDHLAAKLQRTIPVHVCVDTGFGREGLPYLEAPELIRSLARQKAVEFRGVMMTFTEDAELDPEELKRFVELCESLRGAGIRLGRRHAASSYPLFQHPDSFLDMVRPGMALYGIYSEPEFRSRGAMDLRPALRFNSRVIQVKQFRKGDSAGYSPAYQAGWDTSMALVPVGHADGWPRSAAKGARVRIQDSLYSVVAVSASHTIIEIGPEPRVKIGDVVTLFDWKEGSRPEDIAAACGASVYDQLMHLSALLPRKVLGE